MYLQLNLSGNQLCGIYSDAYGRTQGTYDAGGITALSEALKVSASLTECKLRVNKLGVEVWTIIFNALCDSTIIFDALCDSPASKITIWDLSREFLGPKIAKPLAEYISVTASLTLVR